MAKDKPSIISITYGYYLDEEIIEKIILKDCAIHSDPLSYKLEKLKGVKHVKYPHNRIGIEITLYENYDQDELWEKITNIINKHIMEE